MKLETKGNFYVNFKSSSAVVLLKIFPIQIHIKIVSPIVRGPSLPPGTMILINFILHYVRKLCRDTFMSGPMVLEKIFK
jgi:hypothetical protein